MTFVEYLLIGFVAFLAIGGWVTYVTFRHAEDGCEDALGFHSGDRPMAVVRVAAPTPTHLPQQVENVSATLAGTVTVPQTTTHSVTPDVLTIRRGLATLISPLYRRHRRQSQSPVAANPASPLPTSVSSASLSPFEKQCALTRTQANQVQSADPFGSGLAQKTPDPKA